MTDTVSSALADAVEETTAPLTDTVSSATEPITQTVETTTAPLTDAVSSATEPITQTVETTTAPLTDTVSSAAAPITETVETTIAPITDTVSSATAPITETVETTIAPITDTVSSAAAPVADTLDATLAPVTDTVSSALAPVADTLDATIAPLTDTVSSATAPVADTLDATIAPVTDTVSASATLLANPLDSTIGALADAAGGDAGLTRTAADTLNEVLAPVNDTVAGAVTPVGSTVETVVTPVNDTVDAVVTPVTDTVNRVVAPVADSVAQGAAPLADAVDTATRPVALTIADETSGGATIRDQNAAASGQAETAAAPSVGSDGPQAVGTPGGGAGPSGDPPAPGEATVSADDPLGSIQDALSSALQPDAGVLPGPLAGPVFGDPSLTVAPFGAPPGAGTVEASAPGAPDPTVIDAITATATDPQVLVATAVAFTVGLSLHGTRILCAGEAQLMFTNVRLLPCLIRDGVQQHIAPLVSALPGTGAAAPAAALSPAQGAVHGASGTEAGAPDRGAQGFRGLTESFRDGFEDAIEGGRRDVGDALGDSRLMIQLGMALGFVYAAFVSVWFWATRLRGRPVSGERKGA
ncbi:MAG TPA: hypothetical protein VNO82_13485 [Solirubrobacteraceae bacterium]|nr:hypothetical protein [Solirubrobacteraceae bacterium]